MPDIRLDHVSRVFSAFKAVDDITTVFAEGTVTCLLGPLRLRQDDAHAHDRGS